MQNACNICFLVHLSRLPRPLSALSHKLIVSVYASSLLTTTRAGYLGSTISGSRGHALTLNEWVKRVEVDAGVRDGVSTAEAHRVQEQEREVKELRRANATLTLASAFFAPAEPGRRFKF